MSALKNINQEKAAQVLFVLFLAAALWEQFAPQPEPGMMEYNQAKLVMKSDPSPEDEKKACSLFATAVRAGSKDAAFGWQIASARATLEMRYNAIPSGTRCSRSQWMLVMKRAAPAMNVTHLV